LLFYDPTTPNTGEGEFYTTDGSGNIAFLKKHTDWRKTWKLIVPGNFGGNDYTDLLFYDTTATSLTAPIVVTVPPANAPTIPQGFHSPFSFTPSGAPVIQWLSLLMMPKVRLLNSGKNLVLVILPASL
jgi:hypothetical protein